MIPSFLPLKMKSSQMNNMTKVSIRDTMSRMSIKTTKKYCKPRKK